jgi:hypothetical protein
MCLTLACSLAIVNFQFFEALATKAMLPQLGVNTVADAGVASTGSGSRFTACFFESLHRQELGADDSPAAEEFGLEAMTTFFEAMHFSELVVPP